MVLRTRLGAFAGALCLFVGASLPAGAQEPADLPPGHPPVSQTPSGAPKPTGALDLTDKIDNTPMEAYHGISPEVNEPRTPPQTVEGVLVSVDPSGTFAVVRTEQQGEVKLGLPTGVYVSRRGRESTVEQMHPGDRIYATVVTANGNRALRIVSEPPVNPLVNLLGIPALLLAALAIWWSGRRQGHIVAEVKSPAKSG